MVGGFIKTPYVTRFSNGTGVRKDDLGWISRINYLWQFYPVRCVGCNDQGFEKGNGFVFAKQIESK